MIIKREKKTCCIINLVATTSKKISASFFCHRHPNAAANPDARARRCGSSVFGVGPLGVLRRQSRPRQTFTEAPCRYLMYVQYCTALQPVSGGEGRDPQAWNQSPTQKRLADWLVGGWWWLQSTYNADNAACMHAMVSCRQVYWIDTTHTSSQPLLLADFSLLSQMARLAWSDRALQDPIRACQCHSFLLLLQKGEKGKCRRQTTKSSGMQHKFVSALRGLIGWTKLQVFFFSFSPSLGRTHQQGKLGVPERRTFFTWVPGANRSVHPAVWTAPSYFSLPLFAVSSLVTSRVRSSIYVSVFLLQPQNPPTRRVCDAVYVRDLELAAPEMPIKVLTPTVARPSLRESNQAKRVVFLHAWHFGLVYVVPVPTLQTQDA